MALINCPECGKEVSDKAKACPNCAYPVAQLSNIPKISVEAQNIAVKWPVEILTPVERPELQKEEFCTSENRRKDRRIKTRKARILKVIAISSIVVAMILIATTSFFDMSMKLNLSDNDEKTDYFYQFQQYIIDNGYYDDERGAFLKDYVSNYEIRYIFAKDDTITYLSIYTSDSAIGEVVFGYKLTYRIDGSTAFKALLKNGDTVSPMIPYSAAAKVSGCINPITGEIVSIVEETYIQCKKESIIRLIKDWHNDCVTHITDKMKLAEIVVTYEQLFGLPD